MDAGRIQGVAVVHTNWVGREVGGKSDREALTEKEIGAGISGRGRCLPSGDKEKSNKDEKIRHYSHGTGRNQHSSGCAEAGCSSGDSRDQV